MGLSSVNWSQIQHVLLDMDGTVLDLAFDNHFWREVVPQRYAAQHGVSVEAARAELEPHFTQLRGRLEWYCLDHWSGITRLDLAAIKREVRHDIRLLSGSLDFLEAVRRSGKTLWLVTNAHVDSWVVKLDQTGLRHHFDAVICSHDFAAPKEQAEFWRRFVATHPFDPATALFVDDSLPVLRAARAFGIGCTIGVRCPDSRLPRPDLDELMAEFHAVDGLKDLLPIA